MEVRLIFHLTHGRNLHGVLAAGRIWSTNHLPADLQPRSIAHESIQDRRARKVVPVGPGGVLHDYVPFYFGARSPMLYANHRGTVPSNPDGQELLIYLISTVERVMDHNLGWVFTDGHAAMAFTRYFADAAHLDQVDWPTVAAKFWFDTVEDPDRKRRKQAEFLVFRFMPVTALVAIAVHNEPVAGKIREFLAAAGLELKVLVLPGLYY